MAMRFGDATRMRFDVNSKEVHHMVEANGVPILCRIAASALLKRYGDVDHLTAAQKEFDGLTDRWGGLIQIGQRQPDGSILITHPDW